MTRFLCDTSCETLESAIKIEVRYHILLPIVARPKAMPSIVGWGTWG